MVTLTDPSEEVQDQREAARGAGGPDPVVGGVLGQAEDLRAVAIERSPGAQARGTGVQLGQMGDQLHGGRPLAAGEVPHARQQRAVRELGGSDEKVMTHDHLYVTTVTGWDRSTIPNLSVN